MAQNVLYIVPIQIRPLPGSEMPKDMKGAIAVCFAGAPNHLTAISKVIQSLKEKHYEIVDLAGNVETVDEKKWDEYVKSVWPEFSQQLPLQEAVVEHVLKGSVFYGPFCGWEEA